MLDEYGEQSFQPLSINLWEDWSTIKYYASQNFYPFLRDGGAVWNTWKIRNSIPTNYVVDGDGTVRYGVVGWNEVAVRAVIEQYLTGVSETPAVQPLEFSVVGANPVVGRSAVRFKLPKAANATLRVYSTSGALVRTLFNGHMPSGVNTVDWNLRDDAGRAVGNGLYVYELVSDSQTAHAKVSVLK
jgi:hypothetical protein